MAPHTFDADAWNPKLSCFGFPVDDDRKNEEWQERQCDGDEGRRGQFEQIEQPEMRNTFAAEPVVYEQPSQDEGG